MGKSVGAMLLVAAAAGMGMADSGYWLNQFPVAGTDGYVFAAVADSSGSLYIGGRFTVAGNVVANGVARWDPSTGSWSSLGAGMDGDVLALTMDSMGNLYASGSFTSAGDTPAQGAAKWDGSTWSGLGSGIDGYVPALAADSMGNIYAGGQFSMDGGETVNVARWNGAVWSPLGTDTESAEDRFVKAIVTDDSDNVYVSGSFTTIGGVAAERIAKWDGAVWSALGADINGGEYIDIVLNALANDHEGNIYVAGGFRPWGSSSETHRIAKWDGTAWMFLGSSFDWQVECVAVDKEGNPVAGGCFSSVDGVAVNGIARWDGAAWSALGTGLARRTRKPNLFTLTVDAAGNLYAGGDFHVVDGVPALNIAKLDTTGWSPLGTGISGGTGGTSVYAITLNNCCAAYVGGNFTKASEVDASNIARWDGTRLSALGKGVNGTVLALAVDGRHTVYAGGNFTRAGNVDAHCIAKWNGWTWLPLGSGVGGDRASVSVIAADGEGNVYAGGTFSTAGGEPANNIAKWNGESWTMLGGGMGGEPSCVEGIAVDKTGDLYAGFLFPACDCTWAKIAKWDGTEWLEIGAARLLYSSKGPALVTDASGNLYAGGGFATVNDVLVNGIAKWDGATWSSVGTGVEQSDIELETVNTLAVDGAGNLYAGGKFTMAGGVVVNNLAKWDGTAWSPLGAGVNRSVNALAVDRVGNVYAGGYFTRAGGNPSGYFGVWQPYGEGECGEDCEDELPFGCFSAADGAAVQSGR